MSAKEIGGTLVVDSMKLCLVVSRFNDFLTGQLLKGATDCLVRHGGSEDDITIVWVPGANELPMAVKRVVSSGKFDAVAALGTVIKGATPHANLINTNVARALGSMATESDIPIMNGLVSADTLDQAIERCGTKAGNKGWAAVQAAIEMVDVFKQIG